VRVSKFFPALIGLVALGFVIEARDAKHPSADRIGQCQTENITDTQVRECTIRLALQAQPDDRLNLLEERR
jgi:hypothetical protein